MLFHLIMSLEQKKFWVPMRNCTSDLLISGLRYTEPQRNTFMKRILHTARISNVNGIKFGKLKIIKKVSSELFTWYLLKLFQPVKSKCLSWLYQQRKCRKLIPTRICNTMVCIKPSLHTKLISISHKKNDILWPVTFPCEKRYFFLIYQIKYWKSKKKTRKEKKIVQNPPPTSQLHYTLQLGRVGWLEICTVHNLRISGLPFFSTETMHEEHKRVGMKKKYTLLILHNIIFYFIMFVKLSHKVFFDQEWMFQYLKLSGDKPMKVSIQRKITALFLTL